MNKYIILGGGGWAGYVLAMFHDCMNSRYYSHEDKQKHFSMFSNICGIYVDDDPLNHTQLKPYQILTDLREYKGYKFIPAVATPTIKRRQVEYALSCGLEPCEPIVHPHVETYGAEIGPGSMIAKMVSIEQNAKIGSYVSCAPLVSIAHDTIIGEFTTILPNAAIASWNEIGQEVLIGAGSVTNTYIKIGNRATIGLGAVILKNVPEGATAIGNPARILGTNKV